jgi:TM2 domain-containing membrane protein YozV
MYCPKCGKEILEGTRYCEFCGCDTMNYKANESNPSTGENPNCECQNGDFVGVHKKKSEGLAAVLSFLIPGLGEMYVGRLGFGILLLVLDIVCAFLTLIFFVPIVGCLIIWVYSIYDSYKGAKDYNQTLVSTGNPPW